MAKVRRFSGQLKMELSFNDRTDQYRVRICPQVRGERCETVSVGTPRSMRQAVDSPAAFSEAAKAAISFASDRVQNYAQSTRNGSGWMVTRPRASRGRRGAGR